MVEIEGHDISNFTLPAKIVLHLAKPYLNKGHCLGIDNWYSDPRLFELLVKHKTDAVGTFQADRLFLPPGVKAKNPPTGYLKTWYKKLKLNSDETDIMDCNLENVDSKHLMCMLWQDKSTVKLLSTYHNDEMLEIPDKSRLRYDKHAKKFKPRACIEYKYVMPGVDKMDQMMSTYDPTRKRLKRYYKRVYFTLLEMAFYNSYVVYCHLVHPKKVTYLQYKMEVIKKTVAKYGYCMHKTEGASTSDRIAEIPSAVLEDFRLHPGQHFPVDIGKVKDLYRECRFCKSQTVKSPKLQGMKRMQRTTIMCKVCHVPLCTTPCFDLYHTEVDYRNYEKKRQKVS